MTKPATTRRREAGAGAGTRLRLGVQWALGLLILWLLFRSVPFGAAVAAARAANLGELVAVSTMACLTWFWLDAAALSYLITRFHTPFSAREARSIRALSYLVAIVNWNLGSGAMMLHLRRTKEVPLSASLATILFYNSLDGFVLLGMATVGFATTTREMDGFAAGVAIVLAGLAILITTIRSAWPDWGITRRLRAASAVRTIRIAVMRDFVVAGLARLAYFSVFVLYFWLALLAFSVEVSPLYLMGTVPLVLLAGVLPITPAGLGTQQAVMLFMLAPFGDEASILAFGLVFPVSLMLARVLLALFYLPDLAGLRRTLSEA